jgi:hypothetical protein
MDLLWLLITGGVAGFGYVQSRRFVRHRLRFVDAVRRPGIPLAVGAIAALAAAPVAAVLPIVGGVTAALFGTGVGLGVHHGVKDHHRLPGY